MSHTIWSRPRSQGKSFLSDALREYAEKQATRLDNEIMSQIVSMESGNTITIDRELDVSIKGIFDPIPFNHNHKVIYINKNSYTINKKVLIV